MKSYWVKDTDRKILARSLTLVIFADVRQFVVDHVDISQWRHCCHFL